MSEVTLKEIREHQASAMWTFVKRCRQVMSAFTIAGCAAIAITLLITGITLQAVPVVAVIWLVMVVYPFVQMIWIKLRTGLWWHSLNAQASWIGIAGIMGLLLIMLLYYLQPLFEGVPIYGARIGYEPLVLIIILPLFRSAFKSSTRLRARTERISYGAHWLTLGRLTFWDILLLRIPHERA